MSLYSRFLAGVFVLLLNGWSLMGASISSFSPTIGGANDQVTIYGTGFYPGTLVVRFNGVVASAQATAQNGTIIEALVPATATNGPISVTINGGTPAFSATDFTVIGP